MKVRMKVNVELIMFKDRGNIRTTNTLEVNKVLRSDNGEISHNTFSQTLFHLNQDIQHQALSIVTEKIPEKYKIILNDVEVKYENSNDK